MMERVIKPTNNSKILDEFYSNSKFLVTKEDLLNKGFDFSEFFSTSWTKHHFDNEETNFEYKDFVCDGYYVKIIWINRQIDGVYVRLYFQLVKFNYGIDLLGEIQLSESLLSNRKFNAGFWWVHTFETEIENKELAQFYYEKYYTNEAQIDVFISKLKASINGLNNTKEYFEKVLEKMADKKSIEDGV